MKYTIKYNFKRCQPKWIGDYVRMFGERNEGVEVEAETPEKALDDFAKEHRYNKFYLEVVDAHGRTLIGATNKVAEDTIPTQVSKHRKKIWECVDAGEYDEAIKHVDECLKLTTGDQNDRFMSIKSQIRKMIYDRDHIRIEVLRDKRQGSDKRMISRELLKIAKALMSAERLEFNIGKGPRTPWGKAQVVYKIDTGVNWYDTASHGGLGVSSSVAHRSLSPQARKLGEQFAGGFWYEEDVAWNIPFYENPDWQVRMVSVSGGQVYAKDKMEENIRHWFPSYFEQEFIDKSNKPRFRRVDLQLNDIITINGRPSTFKIVFVPQRFGKVIGRDVLFGRSYAMPRSTFEERLLKVERDGKVIWSRD